MPRNVVLERMVDERDRAYEAIDDVLAAAEADEREPNDTERGVIQRHRTRIAELEPQIGELVDLEDSRDARRDARTTLQRARTSSGADRSPTPAPTAGPDAIYRTFAQYARDELIVRFDPIAAAAGGPASRAGATDRLQRVTNTLTSDVPGLVPPQHVAQIFEQISTDRPVTALGRSVALTSGAITYPAITQRPAVGKQTAEKTEGPASKLAVAMRTLPAETFIGSGDLSWQTVTWSNPDALALWFSLCAESYAGQTEAVVGTLLAAATPTVTVATDDLAGWVAAITEAAHAIFDATKGGGNVGKRPNAIACSSDVGFHLISLVSNLAPIFLNIGGGSLAAGGTPSIGGLAIVISGGLPDGTAVVGNFASLLVAETSGSPVQLRAIEPAIGGYEVGVIGAFAAVLADPAAFVGVVPPPPPGP
jgi:HK97 family phage major capsid protein